MKLIIKNSIYMQLIKSMNSKSVIAQSFKLTEYYFSAFFLKNKQKYILSLKKKIIYHLIILIDYIFEINKTYLITEDL